MAEAGVRGGTALIFPFSHSSLILIFPLADYMYISVHRESGVCSMQGSVPQRRDTNGSQEKQVRASIGAVIVAKMYHLLCTKDGAILPPLCYLIFPADPQGKFYYHLHLFFKYGNWLRAVRNFLNSSNLEEIGPRLKLITVCLSSMGSPPQVGRT